MFGWLEAVETTLVVEDVASGVDQLRIDSTVGDRLKIDVELLARSSGERPIDGGASSCEGIGDNVPDLRLTAWVGETCWVCVA